MEIFGIVFQLAKTDLGYTVLFRTEYLSDDMSWTEDRARACEFPWHEAERIAKELPGAHAKVISRGAPEFEPLREPEPVREGKAEVVAARQARPKRPARRRVIQAPAESRRPARTADDLKAAYIRTLEKEGLF